MPKNKTKIRVEVFGYRLNADEPHFNRSELVNTGKQIIAAQQLVAKAIIADSSEVNVNIIELKEQ